MIVGEGVDEECQWRGSVPAEVAVLAGSGRTRVWSAGRSPVTVVVPAIGPSARDGPPRWRGDGPSGRTLDARPGLRAEVMSRLRAGYSPDGGGDAGAGLADAEELFGVFDGDLDRPAGDVARSAPGLALVSVDTQYHRQVMVAVFTVVVAP